MLTFSNEPQLTQSLNTFGLNSTEWTLKKLKTKNKALIINKEDNKIYFVATLTSASSGAKIKSLRLLI